MAKLTTTGNGPAPTIHVTPRIEPPEHAVAKNEAWWVSHTQRFLELSEPAPNGCRVWLGARTFQLVGPQRPQIAAYCLHHRAFGVGKNRRIITTCGFEACVEGAHLDLVLPHGVAIATLAARLQAMVDAVVAGETYESIGQRFFISKQRVEQIVRPFLAVCPTCDGAGRVRARSESSPEPPR
jgi:hypothetical protein